MRSRDRRSGHRRARARACRFEHERREDADAAAAIVRSTLRGLEVHALDDDHRWHDVRIHEGDVRVRAEPFTAIELDLSALWVR